MQSNTLLMLMQFYNLYFISPQIKLQQWFAYGFVCISGIQVCDEAADWYSLQDGHLDKVSIGKLRGEEIPQNIDEHCSGSTAGWETSITGHHSSHIGGDTVSC